MTETSGTLKLAKRKLEWFHCSKSSRKSPPDFPQGFGKIHSTRLYSSREL